MFTTTMDTALNQRTRIGAVIGDRARVSPITQGAAWITPKPTLPGTLRRKPRYSCLSSADRTSDDDPPCRDRGDLRISRHAKVVGSFHSRDVVGDPVRRGAMEPYRLG